MYLQLQCQLQQFQCPVTGTTRSIEEPIAATSLSRTAVVVTEDVVSDPPAPEPEPEAAPVSTEAPVSSTTPSVPVVMPRDVTPSDQEDDASVASSLRREMGARRVKAAPGKLGIVIDTAEHGTVVTTCERKQSVGEPCFPR